MSFIDRLRETQRDTKKPRLFEEVLTRAFEKLGFTSKHIGGRDEPDILLEILGHKIVIDAKTATDPIGEARINFDGLERYKKSYGADYVGVVAIGFTRGVVRETAKERHVVLVETEAICRALENHTNYPYTPQHIYETLFGSVRSVITPKGVEPSTKNVSQQIEMIKKVLSDLNRLQKSRRKFNIDEAFVAYRWQNPTVKKEEMENALVFLSSPPFNIVRKEEDDVYSLTLDYAEMRKRLGLLRETLPIKEERITEAEKGKGRGIRIKGKFIPCRRSKDILVETAEWLIERDGLKVPIEAGYRRYLVNREPKHKSGESFRAGKKLSNGWWIETHYSTKACTKNAKRLLKECGLRKEDLTVHGFP